MVVSVQFNGRVTAASVEGGTASYDDDIAVFEVPELDTTPTTFAVALDTCDVEGRWETVEIVNKVKYVDDEGNRPNLGYLVFEGFVRNDFCGDDGTSWGDFFGALLLCSFVGVMVPTQCKTCFVWSFAFSSLGRALELRGGKGERFRLVWSFATSSLWRASEL